MFGRFSSSTLHCLLLGYTLMFSDWCLNVEQYLAAGRCPLDSSWASLRMRRGRFPPGLTSCLAGQRFAALLGRSRYTMSGLFDFSVPVHLLGLHRRSESRPGVFGRAPRAPIDDPPDRTGIRSFNNKLLFAQAVASFARNADFVEIRTTGVTPIQAIRHGIDIHREPGHAAGNAYWITDLLETARQGCPRRHPLRSGRQCHDLVDGQRSSGRAASGGSRRCSTGHWKAFIKRFAYPILQRQSLCVACVMCCIAIAGLELHGHPPGFCPPTSGSPTSTSRAAVLSRTPRASAPADRASLRHHQARR